jgi:hypothetical protein
VFDRVQNPKKGQALTEEEAALSQVLKGMPKGKLIGLLIAGAIHETTPSQEEIRDLIHALTERLWGRGRGDKKKAPAKKDPAKKDPAKSEQAARAQKRKREREDCGNIAATKILVRRR